MKKIIMFAGVVGIISFVGCSSDNKEEKNADVTNIDAAPIQAENANTDTTSQNISSQPVEYVVNPATGPATPAKTAEGMNPPHGEPGHRCEIAVGAPLNSPAGASKDNPVRIAPDPGGQTFTVPATTPGQTPPAQTPPGQPAPGQIKQIPSPTTSGPTPAGMNPPHGEPGHDCAIPVGAPLKK